MFRKCYDRGTRVAPSPTPVHTSMRDAPLSSLVAGRGPRAAVGVAPRAGPRRRGRIPRVYRSACPPAPGRARGGTDLRWLPLDTHTRLTAV